MHSTHYFHLREIQELHKHTIKTSSHVRKQLPQHIPIRLILGYP